MKKAEKSYFTQFIAAMAVYVVVLPISILLIAQFSDSPWRYPVSLLPVIPLIFALQAFLRFFDRRDELQKKIQLSAFGFACGATALITFSYGLLENVGFPQLSLVLVTPLIIALWGIGTAIASRRYQ